MTLFKALSETSFIPHLEQFPTYFHDFESQEGCLERKRRLDKHRLLTIAITGLLANLIEKTKTSSGQQGQIANQMLGFFYYAFDEYCLQPVINYSRHSKFLALATPRLEFIYMFISVAMQPEIAFTQSIRTPGHYHSIAQLGTQGPEWDVKSPLNSLKYKLYQFFKCAFHSSASGHYGEQVRFCDIAALYLQVLKPWDNDREYMQWSMHLD